MVFGYIYLYLFWQYFQGTSESFKLGEVKSARVFPPATLDDWFSPRKILVHLTLQVSVGQGPAKHLKCCIAAGPAGPNPGKRRAGKTINWNQQPWAKMARVVNIALLMQLKCQKEPDLAPDIIHWKPRHLGQGLHTGSAEGMTCKHKRLSSPS